MTFSNNVPYTCQNEEQLATFKADKPLMFPADGQEVSFKAYYPYVENINEYLYPLVLDNQQQGTAPYDLMTVHTLVPAKSLLRWCRLTFPIVWRRLF